MPSNRPTRQGRPVKRPAFIGLLVLSIICWLALVPAAALAATWTGGGADDNWSTALNWLGGALPVNDDTITYDSNSVARLTSGNNDLGLTGITIEVTNAGPAAVAISGGAIGLAGIDTDSPRNTPLTLTINNNLNLAAGGTIALSALSGIGGSSVVNLNGSLSLGANTLSVTGSHGAYGTVSLSFNGGVNGTGGISANGLFSIYANSALSYTGATTLTDACGIQLGGGGSLPSSSAFSLVDGGTGGGAIHLNGNSGTVGSVQAAGNRGAIYFSGGSLTMGGNNASTAFNGWLNGPGSLVKTGTGTFTINSANNSTTSLTVNGGTFRLGAADLLPDTLSITLGASGTFSLNNFAETIGNISGSGTLSLGTGTLTFGNSSNTSFSGNVTATGFGGATINKQGSGSFTVPAGANIVAGIVLFNINSGSFVLNRNWDIAFIDVNNGGTLAGNGNVGSAGIWVHAGGTLAPGNSPGQLATADALALDAGATLTMELNGTTAGTQYDQMIVNLGWDLPGNLNLSLGYAPSPGDSFTIIDNLAGGLGAPFAGLPEGGTVSVNGYTLRITYVGGDGNDVVLTVIDTSGGTTPDPTPEPTPGVDPPAVPNLSPQSSPSPTGSLNGTVLSWPHVAGSNFYRIYRAACPTCAKTQVGRVSSTSFIDQSALPGLVYYYFVRTENGGGLSGYSDWVPAWRYEQNPGRAGDFNGDGIMDLLWWNADGNQLSIWFISGGNVQSVSAPGDALDISQWLLINIGDFNGDVVSDLMWWKPETGEVVVWYLDKAADAASGAGEWMVKSSAALDSMTGNATISYNGDLNGDGKTDLVWRDYATGRVTIWLMGDDGKPALTGPPTLADGMTDGGKPGVTDSLDWALRGLNDMDGDGKADVVWQHASDGRVVVWRMDGSQALGLGEYQRNDPANWRIAGLGDLNGNGRGDMVWRNDSSGAVQAWLMAEGDSGYEARDVTVSADSPAAWRLNATGDFCGDGCADLYCKSEPEGAKRIVTLAGQSFAPAAP
jgi:autotransporter-associated beta strand protein